MLQINGLLQISEKTKINQQLLLGKGSTGNVFEGVTINSEGLIVPAAIKAIDLKTINNEVTSYLLKCQLETLKLLAKESNRFVVKLYEIVCSEEMCYVVMEKLIGGTLREYINGRDNVDEDKCFEIISKVIHGYSAINKHKIIHRDLKPQNIIFRDKNYREPCIIDFGYCINPQVQNVPKCYYNVGSPRYMSPQAYKQNNYSEKSDIWAIGVIIFEMLTKKTLDEGQKIQQHLQNIQKKGVNYPKNLPNHSKKFINYLLTYDHSKRIACHDLIKEIIAYNLFRTKRKDIQLNNYKSMMQNQKSQEILFQSHASQQSHQPISNNRNYIDKQNYYIDIKQSQQMFYNKKEENNKAKHQSKQKKIANGGYFLIQNHLQKPSPKQQILKNENSKRRINFLEQFNHPLVFHQQYIPNHKIQKHNLQLNKIPYGTNIPPQAPKLTPFENRHSEFQIKTFIKPYNKDDRKLQKKFIEIKKQKNENFLRHSMNVFNNQQLVPANIKNNAERIRVQKNHKQIINESFPNPFQSKKSFIRDYPTYKNEASKFASPFLKNPSDQILVKNTNDNRKIMFKSFMHGRQNNYGIMEPQFTKNIQRGIINEVKQPAISLPSSGEYYKKINHQQKMISPSQQPYPRPFLLFRQNPF